MTADAAPSDDELRDFEMLAVDASALMIPNTRGYLLAADAVPRLVAEVRRLRARLRDVEATP